MGEVKHCKTYGIHWCYTIEIDKMDQDKNHSQDTIYIYLALLHHTNECMSSILPRSSKKLLYEVYQIYKWCESISYIIWRKGFYVTP